jgi:DNA-binding SARP family transcriptional activator
MGDPEDSRAAAAPADGPADAAEGEAVTTADSAGPKTAQQPPARWAGTALLRQLQAAPVRVRCFGAREVRYRDEEVPAASTALLLLLAIHPITGVQSESLIDMLWDAIPTDPAGALRKERHKVRSELRRVAPELPDPIPGNQSHSDKVIALDASVVTSDVHEFTELLNAAAKLAPVDAIQAYESALAVYRGDLLDTMDMPGYRWMYDEDPQVALTLRSDLHRRYSEARERLAELLSAGPYANLSRAQELYSALCGEEPYNERLWIALFKLHGRTGSVLGLDSAVRKLRSALSEAGTDSATDIDSVELPANLEQIISEVRARITPPAAV